MQIYIRKYRVQQQFFPFSPWTSGGHFALDCFTDEGFNRPFTFDYCVNKGFNILNAVDIAERVVMISFLWMVETKAFNLVSLLFQCILVFTVETSFMVHDNDVRAVLYITGDICIFILNLDNLPGQIFFHYFRRVPRL